MFFSGSMSATATCSSILWMVALGGPSSITWGQILGNKAAVAGAAGGGEFGLEAGLGLDGVPHRVDQCAGRGQERQAAEVHASS